jgi:DNA-directed RNA polymerase alpha subunit
MLVKETLQNAENLYESLTDIIESESQIKQTIAQEAAAHKRYSVLHEMSGLDVETLNATKQGIRISALKKAGVVNLSQLHSMSVRRITHIDGIGEQSACKCSC